MYFLLSPDVCYSPLEVSRQTFPSWLSIKRNNLANPIANLNPDPNSNIV